MDVNQSQQGPVTVLSVSGPIISDEFGPLDERIIECISSNALKIVIEIEQVPFIDSEGLTRPNRPWRRKRRNRSSSGTPPVGGSCIVLHPWTGRAGAEAKVSLDSLDRSAPCASLGEYHARER